MKKLMFTAIALVAFSSISIANTIALNEEKIEPKEKEIEQTIIISETPCADAWSSDVEFFQSYLGVSLRKAMRLANLAFEKCLDDVYGN